MTSGRPQDDPSPPADRGTDGLPPAHEQAVADLVRDHNRTLHAFLMARLHDAHEAREVAQEAYVRVLQLDKPGAVSFLRAYLFKTAANIAADRVRERGRAVEMASIAEPVDRLTPDRWLLSAEDLEVLKRALLELSPKCRRAFLLYRLEDWSDSQIAEQLGIKPRMVRHYVAYAGLYCRLRVKGLTTEEAKAAAK